MASQAKKINRSNARGVLGRQGEELAARFLVEQGFTIREKNWRCRSGELDLIVERGPELRFIEVKTRRSTIFGYPEEAISYEKRQHLLRAVEFWLQTHEPARNAFQIDVISIMHTNNSPTIDWIQNIALT